MIAGLVLVLLVAGGLITLKTVINRYVDPGQKRVETAGYHEKSVQIGQANISYVEGPDNGPPLLLLHAQHMDWYSYNLVLPELARHYHVFDVDYPGHGKTTVPDDYPMTADRIGADLGTFIETVIKAPSYVTGNSSGGLLSTWLAANRPGLVRAVVLEDPPLFSSEYPRIEQTIAYRSFRTSAQAVRDKPADFLLYWIESNKGFFDKNVGKGSAFALRQAITSYRKGNPGAPLEVGLIKNDTVRQFLRGMNEYDPRFGKAFYDGTWDANQAEELRKITCPVLLLHANTEIMADGTLNGAMSQDEADRAMSLLQHGTYRRVDSTHVIHLAEPEQFTSILEGYFAQN